MAANGAPEPGPFTLMDNHCLTMPRVLRYPPGTVAPNVPPVRENGRLFHGYMKGMYMYPCDEQEKDRMDIFHKLFLVARVEALHSAPLLSNPAPMRILDLGTGTGIWAIDMAEYPLAWVVGMDLANIQPERIPANLRFKIFQDFESPWALGEASFDLIHLRAGCGSVSSWPDMYQRVFEHLKPGFGSFEHVELDLEPRCDDGTLSPQSCLVQWWRFVADATQRVNRPLAYNHWTRAMLEHAGFVDIQEQVIRAPLNAWPADPHLKDVGRWYNLGLTEGLEAFSLGPLTRVARWGVDDVQRIVRDVKKVIGNKKIHAYNHMCTRLDGAPAAAMKAGRAPSSGPPDDQPHPPSFAVDDAIDLTQSPRRRVAAPAPPPVACHARAGSPSTRPRCVHDRSGIGSVARRMRGRARHDRDAAEAASRLSGAWPCRPAWPRARQHPEEMGR
ncbi:MAG: Secondary metabolism regulator lae1 [Phylliscum demangeonii]|nr:MAG: Secondary metabolism regulator lae1 [Phylliscum demangeonii]